MDVSIVLQKYLQGKGSNIIITDDKDNLLFNSGEIENNIGFLLEKIRSVEGGFDEQEFFDKENNRYYSVKRTVISESGMDFNCYSILDGSEYFLIMREFASYSKSISDMSKFQTGIMKKLSQPYDSFLPELMDYSHSQEAFILFERNGKEIIKSFCSNGRIIRERLSDGSALKELFNLKYREEKDGYLCILNSEFLGQRCAVFVNTDERSPKSDPIDISIHNVINLFIQNCLLTEKIVYESEHDKLTGLYNKAKYLSMKEEHFGNPDTIAVYNFDVNNLKQINDNYGHEYGDALLIKAAKSITKVSSDKVFGFRMGGDEYVMIAVDLSFEEAQELLSSWEEALTDLNEKDSSLYCSMACGLVFGSGEDDYDELYAKSDKLMYEKKKALKDNNITSHIVDP